MSVSTDSTANEFYLTVPFSDVPGLAAVVNAEPNAENAATAYALAMVAEQGGAAVYETAEEAAASGGKVQRVTVTMVEG